MTDSHPKFSLAFNRTVRRHRLARNLSQELLSERAAVDRTYIGLLERGQRSPGLDVAKRLADSLNLPLAELVAEAEGEWERGNLAASRDAREPIVAERKRNLPTAKQPADRAPQRRRGRDRN